MRPARPRPRRIHLSLTLLFLWLLAAALHAAGPTVTAPTPSPQAGVLGGTAQFSVTATGTGPFTYAWQLSVGGGAYGTLSNGTRIAGATSSSLQISNLQASDAGNYRCLVSNAGGQSNSGPGTLTVTAPPPPTVTHPANQTVTAGNTATFSVTASGTGPFTYAWQLSVGGGPFVTLSDGGRISGSGTATLQIANVQTSDAGSYRCLVSNAGGQSNSGPATLTVNLPLPPAVTAPSPASQTVVAGTPVTFSVTASGAGTLTYAWQLSVGGGPFVTLSDGGRISGSGTATLHIANAQTSDTGSYRCLVSNAGGQSNSGPATLTVNATVQPPVVSAPVPASQTVQVGGTATITVTATGTGPLTYAWQLNGVTVVGNGRIIINGGTLTITNAQLSDSGTYRCLVSNAGGQTNSGPATVTVVQGTPQLAVKDPHGQAVGASQISRMLVPYKKDCSSVTAIYIVSNAGNAPLTLSQPAVTLKQGTVTLGASLSSTTVVPGGTANLNVSFDCSSAAFGDDFQRTGITLTSNAGNFTFDVSILWEMHYPEQGLRELATAMENINSSGVAHALELCDWRGELQSDPTQAFGAKPGETENLPVVAAAVALWAEPVSGGEDYRIWWPAFLAEQLSPAGTSASSSPYYFQGTELMSFDYSAKSVAAIAGVHAWTYTNAPGAGAGSTRSEAIAYLRAAIGIYALSAGQSWTRTAYGFSDGNAPDPNQTYSFVDSSDRPIVAGPYLALAGERSNSGYWSDDQRAFMFCRALGYDCTAAGLKSGEQDWQATVAEDAASKLPASSDVTIFGLHASEMTGLTDLVAENPGFSTSTAASLLAGIRTLPTLHFLGWPGVRATCLDRDTNRNTVPTLGVVYRLAPNLGTGKEAEFIYPFGSERGRKDSGDGTCSVDLANHVLQGALPSSSLNPAIPLPTGAPLFHYTLGPNGLNAVP